ncbi:MAG: hypothetical protein EU539_14065, partial [Promethearchaeota archaeon]
MIEQDHIKANLIDFSFPRLSGTEDEAKAFRLALKKIKALNLSPSTQEFNFSTFYSRIYPKVALILTFSFLLLLYIDLSLIFTIVISSIIAVIFVFLFIYTRNPEKIRFGRILHSQNLFVKLPKKKDEMNDVKGNL